MAKTRYNCYWNVDFLPNRVEAMLTDRDSNKILLSAIDIKIDNNFSAVERYLESIGLNIFNYQIFENRLSTVYAGKGTYESSELFLKNNPLDI